MGGAEHLRFTAWPTHIDVGLPLHKRLIVMGCVQMVLALYQFYVVRQLRASVLKRLLASIPTVVGLLCFATFFDWVHEVLLRTAILFACSWLGTFKVLGGCINRGPLAQAEHLTFMQFYMLLYLPIFPAAKQSEKPAKLRGRLHDAAHSPAALLVYAVAKLAMLVLVVYSIKNFELPRLLVHYMYGLALIGFLGLLMDAPASVATSFVGLRIIPTFDQPWFATSLADWWGRRWNITTSHVLRTLIYDPIIEGALVRSEGSPPLAGSGDAPTHNTAAKEPTGDEQATANGHSNGDIDGLHQRKAANGNHDAAATQHKMANGHGLANGSDAQLQQQKQHHPRVAQWRRVAGTFATFMVSGVVHEYIINMVIPPNPDGSMPWFGKWTTFFTLQAPMLLAEIKLKKWWQARGLPQLNPWLARIITTLVLISVGGPLFFTPCDSDSDLADRAVGAVLEAVQFSGQGLASLLQGVRTGVFPGMGTSTTHAVLHATSEL